MFLYKKKVNDRKLFEKLSRHNFTDVRKFHSLHDFYGQQAVWRRSKLKILKNNIENLIHMP